jgi:hypothetical protein
MITGLRSVVACDEVKQQPDGRIDYLGVVGETLVANTRPGLIPCYLAIVVDLDGAATAGRLELKASGFEHTFPFRTPTGHRSTGLILALNLPVLREGPLMVRIIDEGRGGKVLKSSFDLKFAAGSEALDASAAMEIVTIAEQSVEILKAGFAARSLH